MHIIAKYTQTAIRIAEYSVGNAEGGHQVAIVGCVGSVKQGGQGVRSHCPQCPMVAEAVEDGVHIIEGHLHRNWNH